MLEVVKLPTLFDLKPIIELAFNESKIKFEAKSLHADDRVDKKEYRYILKFLR